MTLSVLLFRGGSGVAGPTGLADNGKFVKQPVFVVSASGRIKWVDYIPVKQFPSTTALQADRYDDNGALTVVMLGSVAGKIAWTDYLPIVEVADPDTGKWRYDALGFLPVVAIV